MKVYVFDTSESGFHNTSSARIALENYGAIRNQGFGLQGNSFGIPVTNRKSEPLSFSKILPYVRRFIEYAKEHPNDEFKVSNIAIDSIHYPKDFIAGLFVDKPSNVELLDQELSSLVPVVESPTRLLVVSSRNFADVHKVFEVTEKLTHFFNLKDIEIVPAIETLAGRLMNGYTKKHTIPTKVFKTQWERLDLPVVVKKDNPKGTINSAAYYDKMAFSIAYCNNLLVFDDYKDKSIETLIKNAHDSGYNSILYFGSTLDTQNKDREKSFNKTDI